MGPREDARTNFQDHQDHSVG